jgi:hypothetical protein
MSLRRKQLKRKPLKKIEPRLRSDLRAIYEREGDELKVLTGPLSGMLIKGMMSIRHDSEEVEGRPHYVRGSSFRCLDEDAEGLKTGDRLEFMGDELRLRDIKRDEGPEVLLVFDGKLKDTKEGREGGSIYGRNSRR